MNRLCAFLLSLLLPTALGSAVVGPATAQEPQKETPCDWRTALRTTVVEIDRHPDRYYGHCVEVRGVWWGTELSDEAAFVRPFSKPSIGIAARDPLRSEAWRRRPVVATVIGRIIDCAALRAEIGQYDGGDCHTIPHALIGVESARFHEQIPGWVRP